MSRFRRSGDALAAPGRGPRSGRGARLPAASSGTPAKRVLGLLVLCSGSICVGLSGVYVRPLIELLHPLEIAAIRSSVSTFAVALFVLMFSLIARPPLWRPSARQHVWLIAFAVVGIFGCNGVTLLTASSEGSPGVGLSIILGVSVIAARIFESGLTRLSLREVMVGLPICAALALLVGTEEEVPQVSLQMLGWAIFAGVLQGSMLLILVRLEAPLGARLMYGFGIAAGQPLEYGPNPVQNPRNRFCWRCASLAMPTLDAEGLASSVGEAHARPSATDLRGISI